MSYDHICARFNVPAKKGARVRFKDHLGTVTTVRGLMVRVRLDGMKWSRPYVPSDLQWLDAEAESPSAPQQPPLRG